MKIAVILSVYNRLELETLSFYSLLKQTREPDEIIIVDDGSDIEYPWQAFGASKVIRQEHNGFGKDRLNNRAIMESKADYLIFTDGDCIFPPHWVEWHEQNAKRGQFVCGMYTVLTKEENALVTMESIADGSIWHKIPRAYESEPPVWAGNGSTCWRDDAIAVNGLDTRFGWTGADYNFGLRLMKYGLSWIHTSNRLRWFHMWHEKPWSADMTDYKQGDRKESTRLARLWAEENYFTPFGIKTLESTPYSRVNHSGPSSL